MKIGLLTSGGDCPGLNAVIRGAVLNGVKKYGYEFVGFRDGWRGVVEGDYMDLPRQKVRGLAAQGGTIIGTSRTNPFDGPNGTASTQSLLSAVKAPSQAQSVWQTQACPSSVSPRPLTTTCAQPTTPSVSTPLCPSQPRQWTASAPPVNRTTAAWLQRSWAATSAGLHCTPVWQQAHTQS